MTKKTLNFGKHCFTSIISIFAVIVLMATMASATEDQMFIFGTQKELDIQDKYSGFSISFNATNVFSVNEVSKFHRGKPGHPALPQQTVRLLLPIDADLSTVIVTIKNTVSNKLDEEWIIPPAPSFSISGRTVWPAGANIVDGKHMDIYGIDEDYPSSPVTSIFTGKIGE